MRRLLFLLLLSVSFFAQAEQTDEYEEGFFTAYLNRAIEKAMSNDEAKDEPLRYGRHITKYVSAPQFGGYVIGKYGYSTENDADRNSFECRMVRMYRIGLKVLLTEC